MSGRTIASASGKQQARVSGVLHCPKFTVLLLSEAASLIGDRILLIALIARVYQQTQSATSIGMLSMIKALPALALATVAGIFVDRWSHKWTMVIANLLQGLLVLLIAVVDTLPVIFTAYLGMALINQFFAPARAATIPDLVPKEVLLAANSLFALAFVGAIVIGPAVGGWITDRYGLDMAFYVDSITFFVPAVAVGCLAIPQTERRDSRGSLAAEWRAGLALVQGSPELQAALILIGAAVIQIASLSVLGIVLLSEKFRLRAGTSAAGLGMLMSSTGLGMLIGAVLQNFLKRRFDNRQLAAAGAILAGLGIFALPWAPSLPASLACGWLFGLGFVTVQANTQTILQDAPEQLRGRALGLGQAVSGGLAFLGAAGVGLLANQIGTQAAFMASGLIPILAGTGILWRLYGIHQNHR